MKLHLPNQRSPPHSGPAWHHHALCRYRQSPPLLHGHQYRCLSAALRARLLAQGADETSKLLRDLVVVHDKLTRNGWEGVGALPSTVLAKAIRQADMLASEEPSAALEQLAEHLRLHHAAAVARDQAKRVSAMPRDDDGDAPHRIEVTEGSYKEFEDLERSWTRTMPSDLAPLYAES